MWRARLQTHPPWRSYQATLTFINKGLFAKLCSASQAPQQAIVHQCHMAAQALRLVDVCVRRAKAINWAIRFDHERMLMSASGLLWHGPRPDADDPHGSSLHVATSWPGDRVWERLD